METLATDVRTLFGDKSKIMEEHYALEQLITSVEAVVDTDRGAKTVCAGKEPSKKVTSNSVIFVDGVE